MLSGGSVHTSHYPSASEVFREKKNLKVLFSLSSTLCPVALSRTERHQAA